MTAGTSLVRPAAARVVRQDRASASVFPMYDALPASERTSQVRPSDRPVRLLADDAYADRPAALYVYSLRHARGEHVGVVAAVDIEGFVNGRVRGHEEVQPDRVEALVAHFESTPHRTELVALLHRAGPVFERVVAERRRQVPLVAIGEHDGWSQSVWPVPPADEPALRAELGDAVHYVADGHHRVAASLAAWRRAGKPEGSSVLCALYPLEGLHLLAFHRRVAGRVDVEALLGLIDERFELRRVAAPTLDHGVFALYADGSWYDVLYGGKRAPGVAGLDLTLLDDWVLRPLLDGATHRVEIASALIPIAELTGACDQDGGVLFALHPPTLRRLTEIADRDEVMPPKTTYFDPKPYAGIFVT